MKQTLQLLFVLVALETCSNEPVVYYSDPELDYVDETNPSDEFLDVNDSESWMDWTDGVPCEGVLACSSPYVICVCGEDGSWKIVNVSDSSGNVVERDFYMYDEQGRVTRVENDRDADGIVDWIIETVYEDDRMIEYIDHNADGVPDAQDTTYYDENGNMIRFEQCTNAYGINVVCIWKTYRYDDEGRLIEEVQDYNGDDIPDRRESYVYIGGLVIEEVDGNDGQADGKVDLIIYSLYGRDGCLIWIGQDHHADGTLDYTMFFVCDENCDIVEYREDCGADGSIDYTIHYSQPCPREDFPCN